MNTPTKYSAYDLQNSEWSVYTRHRVRGLVPARPLGWSGLCLVKRFKLAWGVFTARYDVLDWEENDVSEQLTDEVIRKVKQTRT